MTLDGLVVRSSVYYKQQHEAEQDGIIWVIIARRSGLDGAMGATIVQVWVIILQNAISYTHYKISDCFLSCVPLFLRLCRRTDD